MLKRIELSGFKSFADKVVLEFPAGLIAIVGPNGSGKSNVIDAFRWLLGEREALNLRGLKVEDLIFAGTPERPRVGLAQATLCLDNSNKRWPIEFSEISIKRQISRDGESKYFLNQDEVRLRDLIDFFAKARLGSRGIALVGQGDSDIFIKNTPKERKLLLEEILGLKEYRLKKGDSERRLENTDINLEKVRTQTEEILPRLKLLKRQTGKWIKRGELLKELRDLEDKFFGSQLAKINQETLFIDLELEKSEKELNKQKEVLNKFEADLEKIEKSEPHSREELKKVRSGQNKILEEKFKIERELGRLEVQLEGLNTKKTLPKSEDLIKMLSEIKKWFKNLLDNFDSKKALEIIQESLNRIEDILSESKNNERYPEFLGVKKNLESTFLKLDNDLKYLKKEEVDLTASLEEFNKVFRKSFEVLDKEKNLFRSFEERRNKLILEREKRDFKRSELENELSGIGRRLSEINVVTNVEEENFPDLEKRMFKLRSELSSIGEIDEILLKETQETEDRYNFLTHEALDLEKASRDLKVLIKELEEKLYHDFKSFLERINEEFNKFFGMLFGGGKAKLVLVVSDIERDGIDIELSLPKKKIKGLEALSGGERSLVSMAILFALVSISPPPFLILDEIDAALDEKNARRFATIIRDLSRKTQFIVVTHNRATMEAADVLYGITMDRDGTSKVLSLKLSS